MKQPGVLRKKRENLLKNQTKTSRNWVAAATCPKRIQESWNGFKQDWTTRFKTDEENNPPRAKRGSTGGRNTSLLLLDASTNTETYRWCEHTAFRPQWSSASSKSKCWDKAKKTQGRIAAAELVASWEVLVSKVNVQGSGSRSSKLLVPSRASVSLGYVNVKRYPFEQKLPG